ncbi:hypothetical protein B0H21DRAFT_716501, partial [Amylocystis lapponica]
LGRQNLLKDEPFLTEFALREAHNESRSRKGGRNWNESISEKLFEHAWLGFAFSGPPKEAPYRIGLHVFIEFYWRLYPGGEESERSAEQYLRQSDPHADSTQKRVSIIHLDDGYDAENSQAEDDIRDHPPPIYLQLQEGEHSNVISPSDTTLVRKRKALTERPSTSSAHSSPSERDVPPEHPPKCSASAIVTTTVPFHEDVAAPDSSPLSELPSESDNERAQQIVALKKKKKKKKQCAVAAVRRQPSRHAAHPERLSQMMTRENKYGKGSKRAVLDDSLSDGDRDTQVRPSVPPRLQLGIRGKRGKKASASIAPSAAAVALVGGTDKRASSPRDEDHVPEALANIATPAASATLGLPHTLRSSSVHPSPPDRKPKVQPRRSVRLLPQADASQVDSASANVASSDSPTNQASKKPTASSTRVLRPRKRSRDMLDATNADDSAGRESTSGCVASTADVDRILRDAATEAIEVQNIARSFPDAASDWDGEDEEHARPPDSSGSDDETLARQLSLSVAQSRSSNGKPPAPEDPIMTPPFPHFSPQDFETSPVNVGRVEPMPDVGIEHPPIWAQSRQEVCESFDHFRSYQGGVYFLKDMVKGYLLSAFSANRDIFEHDGRLIVSHGGGKAQGSHVEDGKSKAHEADDQLAEDKSVRALLNTYALRLPVVLLIDDKYTLFPYNLGAEGYTYVVLGFYHITHAWAEPQPASNSRGYVVRYKFAFQWCQRQGVPWWIKHKSFPSVSSTISIPVSSGGLTPAESHRTALISTMSHCGTISPTVYRKGWTCLKPGCIAFWRTTEGKVLSPSTEYAENFLQLLSCNHCNPQDLRPPTPLGNPSDGVTTSRAFCKGWHCTSCGRLSCRYKWEHWECRNCGEGILGQNPPENLHTHWIAHDSGKMENVFAVILPNGYGKIYLIRSRPLTNKDADDLAFRRWPLRMVRRGTLLTNYFSQNSGEPYQYVGGTENTVPWDEAPQPVRGALELIKRRMQLALGKSSTFNEVLSAAYMEKQSMAFHSDSERGLGPVVASLSLGSAAFMHFRPLVTGKSAKPGNALTLYLRHGDVVVMEGAEVQTCYEHTVVPRNFRIAATARSIGLNDAPNSGC